MQQILSVDILKIANALSDKLDYVSNYFVDTEIRIYVKAFDNHHINGLEQSYSIEALVENASNLLSQYPKIIDLNISVHCLAFKKAIEKIDVVIKNELLFQDLHYSILANQDLLIKKAYGQSISESDTKLIVDYNLQYIVDQIKKATGLNN